MKEKNSFFKGKEGKGESFVWMTKIKKLKKRKELLNNLFALSL